MSSDKGSVPDPKMYSYDHTTVCC